MRLFPPTHLLSGRTSRAALAASGLTLVFLLVGAFFSLGPTDDAFITYRCAQNMADGHGLVFNPHERVEATSEFLFAVLLALLVDAGASPQTGGLLLNGSALWLMVFLALLCGPPRSSDRSRWSGLLLVGLLLCPSLLLYLWVGLATVFYTAWLTISVTFLLSDLRLAVRATLAGVFLGLAATTRLEAVIFVPPILAFLQFTERTVPLARRLGLFLVPLALLIVPVLALRWSYYGYPFPNTYYAKVDGGGAALVGRGLRYLLSFFTMYIAVPLVLLAGVARAAFSREMRPRALLLVAIVAAQSGLVVFVGGDFFPYARFMLPVLPVVAMLTADVATTQTTDGEMQLRPAFWAALALTVFSGFVAGSRPGHFRFAVTQRIAATGRAQLGELFRENLPGNAVLLVGAAGATPYFSGLRSYDIFGLTDPVLAHRRLPIGRGLAGHDKQGGLEQLLRLSPDVIVFVEWPTRGVPPAQRRRLVRGSRRAFDALARKGSVLSDYELMRVRSEHHLAVCGVKKDLLPNVGPAFEAIEPDQLGLL